MVASLVGSNMPVDYHSKLGFPAVEKPTGRFTLEPTAHAKEKGLPLPSHVTLTPEMYNRDPEESIGQTTDAHVFEITVEGGRVVKLGVRMHYDRSRDMCLIVKPHRGIIITAWYNYSDDGHETLDTSNYATP